ncbi:MAG: type II secretion system F family protein [Neisseriaceae bacterium]
MAKNTRHTLFQKIGRRAKLRTYEFQGINQLTQEEARGRIQAANDKEARWQLLYRNIKISSLKPVRIRNRKLKAKDITVFTRQLASMLRAGLPLTQALNIIGKGSTNQSMAAVVFDLRNQVEQGSTLTSVLEKYPKYFDGFYTGLVRAGETGGLLEVSLNRIALQREKTGKLLGNVRRALLYPAFVLLTAIGVMFFMLVWVLPVFKDLYKSVGAELPALTQALIGFSNLLLHWGWLLLLIAIAAGVIFVWAYRNNLAFKIWITGTLMRLPLFGMIIQRAEASRWARTFANLYAAGVPMTEVLALVAKSSKNILFRQGTERIRAQVSQGESLVSSIVSCGELFPPLFIQLTEVGEEAGTLEEMMYRIADYFEEEVNSKVSTLETVFEPLMVVALGVLVAILLIAMYMPIFNFASFI